MMDWRKISRAIMSWVLESTWGHILRGLVPNGPSAVKKSSSVDRVTPCVPTAFATPRRLRRS